MSMSRKYIWIMWVIPCWTKLLLVELLMFVLINKRRKLPRIINLSLRWIYNFQGATTDGLKSSEFILITGKFQSKKCSAQMKEREKCKQTSRHWPQCAKWFSRYSISKSRFWAKWTLLFCRFSTSFSLKYDVTDAMLQDNKKLNCNV